MNRDEDSKQLVLMNLLLVTSALQKSNLCMACFDDGYLLYEFGVNNNNKSGSLVHSFWSVEDLINWAEQVKAKEVLRDFCKQYSGKLPAQDQQKKC